VISRRVSPLLAAIAAAALTTSTLFARIGETEQECAARYGEPSERLPNNSLLYRKSGLFILITFFNGKADSIAYRKIAKVSRFSENEIEILLKNNSGGVPWQEREGTSVNREWLTENGELLATYITHKHSLMVTTKDYLARWKAKKEAKEVQNLEGF
jgi:hypothetical protein